MINYKKRDFVCFIPAKGNSKRIPKKNIRPFLGKPIIHHPIISALDTNIFDEIFVYTNCKDVIDTVKECPVKIESEPKSDNSKRNLTTCLTEFLRKHKNRYKYLCLMMPTSVFVNDTILKNGLKYLIQVGFQTVFSAKNLSIPIDRAFQISDAKRQTLTMVKKDFKYVFTQDIKESYFDAGQFYWIDIEKFNANPHIFNENTGFLEINKSVDIDNPIDWEIAELMYKFHKYRDGETFLSDL